MPGITGQGTTFNLPNYVGELFSVTPTDTPFLSSIGGLTGGQSTNSTLFQWQGYDLRDAENNRQRLEGADAPTPEARTRFNVTNVVEVHQEAIAVSYTKLAASGQYASTGAPAGANVAGIDGSNPVLNEMDWQVRQALVQIARDAEVTFLTGEFAHPGDNASPRRTRGLLEAITSNVVDAGGELLDSDGSGGEQPGHMLLDLLQMVWENGGIMESDTATVMANGFQKRRLTKAFISDANYQEASRTVGGVRVSTIETDFGVLNMMLNRHMPTDTVVVTSLEQCAPVFLNVPDKGFLFVEPLAKTGASDRNQIYGELGLRYGNEKTHGKITGLATSTGDNGADDDAPADDDA
jgi:hypothetical protein